MSLTTAKLKATLRRNEPAGVKILKTLCIANCMKSLPLYAGLQNELPTQPGPFDPKYVPMDVIMVATPIPSPAPVEAQVGSSRRNVDGKANHEKIPATLVNTRGLAIEDGTLDGGRAQRD